MATVTLKEMHENAVCSKDCWGALLPLCTWLERMAMQVVENAEECSVAVEIDERCSCNCAQHWETLWSSWNCHGAIEMRKTHTSLEYIPVYSWGVVENGSPRHTATADRNCRRYAPIVFAVARQLWEVVANILLRGALLHNHSFEGSHWGYDKGAYS